MRREKRNLISDISWIKKSKLIREKSKFEVHGEERIEKEVRQRVIADGFLFPQIGWESVQKSFALMRGKKDDIYVLYSLTSLNSDDGSQSLARRIR